MPKYRTIVGPLILAGLCVLTVIGRADAQACSINSTAPGPLACAVTMRVTTTIRMPTLVSVNVIPVRTFEASRGAGRRASVVEAALEVRANRSYSLQIGSASENSSSELIAQSDRVSWSVAGRASRLSETVVRPGSFERPMGDHAPFVVALSHEAARPLVMAAADPIRLILTIVAP